VIDAGRARGPPARYEHGDRAQTDETERCEQEQAAVDPDAAFRIGSARETRAHER
jgi:hypothetical protein